jgi:hypothetical protein
MALLAGQLCHEAPNPGSSVTEVPSGAAMRWNLSADAASTPSTACAAAPMRLR